MSNLLTPFHTASPEQRAGFRLVTQNLLTSASLALKPEIPDDNSVQDLSTLIDLYCLYDKLVIMQDPSSDQLFTHENELFKLFSKNKTVLIEKSDKDINLELIKDAEKRLRLFLTGKEPDVVEGFLGEFLDPENVKKQVEILPFDPEIEDHFLQGVNWLRNITSYKDLLARLQNPHIRRSAFFVARTFFYISYANIRKYTLAPDAARSKFTKPILDSEKMFVGQLMKRLNSSYKPHGIYPELESMISPLSVIVYERAGRKEDIIPQMESLREELNETRQNLINLELEALNKGTKQSQKALSKWQSILSEIDKTFKGNAGNGISYDKAADLTEATVDTVTAPYNPKGWIKILKLPFEAIKGAINRGPLIEIHKLQPQLGSVERIEKAIKRLFKN